MFSSSTSFADVVNKEKSVKSFAYQTDLAWVSSDTPVQTVSYSVVTISVAPGSVSTGTQSSSGKSGLASSEAGAPCEPALQADRSSGSPGAGPSFSTKRKTMIPGVGSRSSSEPRTPTDGARSGTVVLRLRAVAGMVKVAWVNAPEFTKPVASIPAAKTTGTSKKKGGGGRRAKGQDDPIKNNKKKL